MVVETGDDNDDATDDDDSDADEEETTACEADVVAVPGFESIAVVLPD